MKAVTWDAPKQKLTSRCFFVMPLTLHLIFTGHYLVSKTKKLINNCHTHPVISPDVCHIKIKLSVTGRGKQWYRNFSVLKLGRLVRITRGGFSFWPTVSCLLCCIIQTTNDLQTLVMKYTNNRLRHTHAEIRCANLRSSLWEQLKQKDFCASEGKRKKTSL